MSIEMLDWLKLVALFEWLIDVGCCVEVVDGVVFLIASLAEWEEGYLYDDQESSQMFSKLPYGYPVSLACILFTTFL